MDDYEDLHEVKPEFAEKLKKAEKEKFTTFKSLKEMEKYIDNRDWRVFLTNKCC